MRSRVLAMLALVLVPSLAFAGRPITSFPSPPAVPDSLLGPDGLPVPRHAAERSAWYTLVPVGVGTAMFVAGASSLDNGGDAVLGASPLLLLAGGSVALVGLVAGPAAGYSYGGLGSRGAAGVGLRLAAILVPAVAFGAGSASGRGDSGAAAGTAAVVGLCVATVSAIFDISTVEGQVTRRNAGLARPVSWRVEPCALPGAQVPGLAFRATF